MKRLLVAALVFFTGCVGGQAEHKARGNVMFHNGDVDGAIVEFRAAIAAAPKDANAFTLLGNALFEKAKYDESEQAYRNALAIDPHAREARRGLATCELRLGRPGEAPSTQAVARAASIFARALGRRLDAELVGALPA